MRLAVMGTGAIGGYLGPRLAAAGAEVSFEARGADLAAIGAHGLSVQSPLGDLRIAPAVATEAPRPSASSTACSSERSSTTWRPRRPPPRRWSARRRPSCASGTGSTPGRSWLAAPAPTTSSGTVV